MIWFKINSLILTFQRVLIEKIIIFFHFRKKIEKKFSNFEWIIFFFKIIEWNWEHFSIKANIFVCFYKKSFRAGYFFDLNVADFNFQLIGFNVYENI